MRYRYESNGVVNEIGLEREGQRYRALIDGTPFQVEVLNAQPGELTLRVDGRPLRLYWAVDGNQRWIALDGCAFRLDRPSRQSSRSGATGAANSLRAPMPAQVRAVQVSAGERVAQGQTLLILEAMKMEIRLTAPHAGRVTRLLAQAGETVGKDAALVELEMDDESLL